MQNPQGICNHLIEKHLGTPFGLNAELQYSLAGMLWADFEDLWDLPEYQTELQAFLQWADAKIGTPIMQINRDTITQRERDAIPKWAMDIMHDADEDTPEPDGKAYFTPAMAIAYAKAVQELATHPAA